MLNTDMSEEDLLNVATRINNPAQYLPDSYTDVSKHLMFTPGSLRQVVYRVAII